MTRFGRADKDLYLIFDTETSGLLPKGRLVQLAAAMITEDEETLLEMCMTVKPEGFTIPQRAVDIHGISTEQALVEGFPIVFVLKVFNFFTFMADVIIGHNVSFDIGIMANEYQRASMLTDRDRLFNIPRTFCTMKESTKYCGLPKARGSGFKWPKLGELYHIVTGNLMENSHDALHDLHATKEVVFKLKEKGIFKV